MSRLLAGVGAVAGTSVGGLVGAEISVFLRGPSAAEAGLFIGALVGAFGGAMIGAGASPPKRIGTGVGALPSNMGGGLFP